METDHQNTFQPTENRYSSLGGEEFQPEKPDVTGKCLPQGIGFLHCSLLSET